MSDKMNVLLQFNPEQAGLELTEFYRCCVYRTKGKTPKKLSHGSIGVFYRTEVKNIIGEFEIIRVEEIREPETPESRDIYEKAFGYPVTLYDGEYYGPIHFFFRNLKVYTPQIPFEVLKKHLEEKRGSHVGLPRGSILYLDDEELHFIRKQTSITLISGIIDSEFEDPFVHTK